MRGRECCIYVKSIHYNLLSRRYFLYKKLKYQSQNSHNRRSDESEINIYETYKNSSMTHVCHIHKKLSEMAIITMCDFSPYHHALPHWKHMLRCCSRYPIIVTPCQDFYSNTQNMLPTTCFNVYKIIYHFTVHVRRTFEEKITCSLYSIVKPENSNEIFYSQKEIALMETSTYDFHKYRS